MAGGDTQAAPDHRDGPGPGSLFFSYARADQDRALAIVRALEASGHDVWWDGLIDSGARFAEQTETALDHARAVVVAWSAASVASHWVNDEATSGRDRGVLVPVSLDGTMPPIGFRQFQVVDLSSWNGDAGDPAFQRVLRGIEAVGAHPAATHPVGRSGAPVANPPPGGLSRRAMIGIASAGAGVAALAGGWSWGVFGGDDGDYSIAVLPFGNIGGGDQRDYFGEGLSAELRAQLSRNPALRVIAQSSSEAAAQSGGDAAAISRQLGVAYLLDGNVRWVGDTARIAANLIDRASGSNRWSKSFDLTVDDIFAVQSEIAAAVTAAITSAIIDGGNAADPGGTTNATAYDQYLRGRDIYARASSETMDRAALAHFDAAIAADPRFGAAHAARARSLTLIGSLYGSLAETRAAYDAALASARRAVELAPTHAESQSTLGFVLSQGKLDVRAAREPFDRARELGNGDANVLARFAQFAAQTGRFDAARESIDRAVTLDPLNPLMQTSAGLIAYWARDYAAALAAFDRALARSPELVAAQAARGDALLMLGRTAEARAAYSREGSALLRETGLAIVEHRLGNMAAATRSLQQVVAGLGTGQVSHFQQAQIAAQWGQADDAIAALRAGLAAGDSGLITLNVDPMLDPLRRRADFTALLRALHFDA